MILWLWECPGRLAKTSKVSAPKLRASAGETRPLRPWSLEIAEALLDKPNTFENIIFHDWMQPAVQRPLEPTRISYSRTKIPATLCLPLWQRSWRDVLEVEAQAPPLPCEFDERCPSQNWAYEDMGEPCLPLIMFFFFSPWLILIRFDATDQSHLQLPEIHCTNSCLKTNSQSGLLHEEEKRNSCEEGTSTHLFFVPIFAHDLRPHAQVLATSWFVQGYEDKISWEKAFYKEMRKENLLRG